MAKQTPLQQQLVAIRRDFHRYAESKWREFRTASKVAEHLMALGIPCQLGSEISAAGMGFSYPAPEALEEDMQRAIGQGANPALVARMEGRPGVVGVIDTGRPGPVVAFRFDMDSLPFSETGDPAHRPNREGFGSVNEGCCHACGHDGHTAIGMMVATLLMQEKEKLCGKVKLIFQPGEEGGGGARGMVAAGVVDDVTHFFAGHIGLTRLCGQPVLSHMLVCGCKDFLDNRRYNVRYIGKAAHPCGDPHNGRNALLAACAATMAIHTIPPHSQGQVFMYVGVLRAGTARNTVPPEAYFELEIRGNNDTVSDYGEERVLSAVKAAAALYQVDYEIELVGKTPSAQSDDAAIDLVARCAGQVPWFSQVERVGSVGGTDDAADMLRRVQENGGIGAYFGWGSDFTSSFHDRAFDFDEEVLEPAVQLCCALVREICAKG